MLRFRGRCDSHAVSHVRGWVFDPENPRKRVWVEVVCNGRIVHSFVADKFRADLKAAGIGDGAHSFDETLPLETFAFPEASFDLRIAGTDEILEAGELHVDLREEYFPPGVTDLLSPDFVAERHAAAVGRAERDILDVTGSLPAGRGPIALMAVNASAVSPTHRAMAAALRANGYRTAIINSADRRGTPFTEQAVDLVDMIITKRDQGRDFASWLTFCAAFKADIENAEHVLFANDSLIGPLADIRPALDHYHRSNCDFWALSDTYQNGYHLQSSFFILSNAAIRSKGWQLFTASYDYPTDKEAIIRNGEIGLSAFLHDNRLSTAVMCPYEEVSRRWTEHYDQIEPPAVDLHDRHAPVMTKFSVRDAWANRVGRFLTLGVPCNPQHVFWDILLQAGYPFIKRELLCYNPDNIPNLMDIHQNLAEDFRADAERMILYELRRAGSKAPPLRFASRHH